MTPGTLNISRVSLISLLVHERSEPHSAITFSLTRFSVHRRNRTAYSSIFEFIFLVSRSSNSTSEVKNDEKDQAMDADRLRSLMAADVLHNAPWPFYSHAGIGETCRMPRSRFIENPHRELFPIDCQNGKRMYIPKKKHTQRRIDP